MSITFETIADDPALFLFALQNEAAHFQPMTRESFHRSIFLDDRIVRGPGQGFALPLGEVRGQQWPDPASRPIGLIFHVAQCSFWRFQHDGAHITICTTRPLDDKDGTRSKFRIS